MDILGIDIGGVIIQRLDADADTSFDKEFLKTPAVEGAIATIRRLVDARFGAQVCLVSKCGPGVEDLTRQWLGAHGFFDCTAIAPGNIRFCRERAQKAAICSALGVTHFIDDRLEVLGHLESVANLYLFQPRAEEVAAFSRHLERVVVVQSWDEIADWLLSAGGQGQTTA